MTVVYCQNEECKHNDGGVCFCDEIDIDDFSECMTEIDKDKDDGWQNLLNLHLVRQIFRTRIRILP